MERIPSYKELIEDWERINEAYYNRAQHKPLTDHNSLVRETAYIIKKLDELGWEGIECGSIQYKKMEGSERGKYGDMFGADDIFIDDSSVQIPGHVFINEKIKEDPIVRHIVMHEIMHASRKHDELSAELFALEADSQIALNGKKDYKSAFYAKARQMIQRTVSYKLKHVTPPKKYEKQIREIKNTEKEYAKLIGRKADDHANFTYGVQPYVTLKSALKKNKRSIETDYGKVSLKGITRLWHD